MNRTDTARLLGGPPAVETPPPRAGTRPAGLRVLLAESHPDVADSTAWLLRLDGHDVQVARDGSEALAAVDGYDPDVVLLDVALPKLDGYEVARRVKGRLAARTPLLVAVRRLVTRLRELGLRIKLLLLDRFFFGVLVTALLQELRVPFLMPVADRGRKPRQRRRATSGLRWLRRQKAGWYRHTLRRGKQEVRISVCVCYHSYRRRDTGQRRRQKLLFAAWRVRGAPREVHRRYRARFGIETSYRQARQARIHTRTRDPRVRLVFVAVALLLRNLWVWVHAEVLARGSDLARAPQLERLRFRQLLDWVACAVAALMHDGSTPCVLLDREG
jgi:CheY-like chemotaxis protein